MARWKTRPCSNLTAQCDVGSSLILAERLIVVFLLVVWVVNGTAVSSAGGTSLGLFEERVLNSLSRGLSRLRMNNAGRKTSSAALLYSPEEKGNARTRARSL
jgi:hypothetical protein